MSGEAEEPGEKQPTGARETAQVPTGAAASHSPQKSGNGHKHHHLEIRFLDELKRRNVGRVAILYLVVCWLILEPVHVIFHMLEVPAWANRLVIVLMALGFPVALIFAWVYELTPEGLKPAAEVDPHKSIRAQTGQRLNRAILVVMAVALSYFIVDKFWLSKRSMVESSTAPVAAEPSAATRGAPPISDKSIAVLPFADMSEKHDQEYFSDGMAEEIIDLLVKIPELVVPARTSSFYFKGKSTQVPEIAKELGVRNILEGSVRKSGNHLRVTAQLVRADNGYHLWSETYNSTVDDVFKTQDEIAGAVVGALKVSLLGKDAPNAKLTTNSEAYELYLQARSLIYRGTSDDTLRAYANLQKAVELDPTFALAWATLASLLTHDNVSWDLVLEVPAELKAEFKNRDFRHWDRIREQTSVAAHAAAERALKLGPGLADSHAAMAQVLSMDGNWSAADVEMNKALELDPGNARIKFMAADLVGDLGRISEALQLAIRANLLDPLGDSHVLGWLQYVNGNLDQAALSEKRIIQLYPTAERVHFHRAVVLLAQGKAADALTELELEPADVFRDAGRPLVLDGLGRRAEADKALALVEEKDGGGMAYQIAYIYAARKNLDQTFYWLERAYKQHDGACRI